MIKVGIIGTNWITQRMIDAANATGEYQLTAVYSRTEKRAIEFAQQNNCEQTFTQLDEFFASPAFDTVYIASPNSFHYRQVLTAIQNDKNVIIEKPAFLSPYQVQSVFDELKNHPDVHLFEAARNIHMPAFKELKKRLAETERIDGADLTFSQYSSRYDLVLQNQTPNVFNLDFGGGTLADLGIYPLYAAIGLFGKPRKQAYYPTFIKSGADGKGTAVLTYDKFTVTLNFSKMSNSNQNSEVYSARKVFEIDSAGEFTTAWETDQTKQVISDTYQSNPMIPELQDFARVLNHPEDVTNQNDYQNWLELVKTVNLILVRLANTAGIEYPQN
ncbi:Gfo/Idh/MocA family oxidoreductase [Fructilactobacillus vespulae]|uniref:Gfo/Idh/MocA family protein n=1 Tax=Fructilactobacillus vespulae TaxID=1249630 RepID=UPI0039B6793D